MALNKLLEVHLVYPEIGEQMYALVKVLYIRNCFHPCCTECVLEKHNHVKDWMKTCSLGENPEMVQDIQISPSFWKGWEGPQEKVQTGIVWQ